MKKIDLSILAVYIFIIAIILTSMSKESNDIVAKQKELASILDHKGNIEEVVINNTNSNIHICRVEESTTLPDGKNWIVTGKVARDIINHIKIEDNKLIIDNYSVDSTVYNDLYISIEKDVNVNIQNTPNVSFRRGPGSGVKWNNAP